MLRRCHSDCLMTLVRFDYAFSQILQGFQIGFELRCQVGFYYDVTRIWIRCYQEFIRIVLGFYDFTVILLQHISILLSLQSQLRRRIPCSRSAARDDADSSRAFSDTSRSGIFAHSSTYVYYAVPEFQTRINRCSRFNVFLINSQ